MRPIHLVLPLVLAACGGGQEAASKAQTPTPARAAAENDKPFVVTPVADLDGAGGVASPRV